VELCRLSSSRLGRSSRCSHLVEQLQQLEALAFDAPKLIRSVAEAPPCCPGKTLAELEPTRFIRAELGRRIVSEHEEHLQCAPLRRPRAQPLPARSERGAAGVCQSAEGDIGGRHRRL
jgi:hypothetical protein